MSGLVAFQCTDPLFGFCAVEVPAEPGVLDERARVAFTTGHCHSLAVAVHERTDLPVVKVESPGGEVLHMGVRDGEDFVGIRGRRPCAPDAIMDRPSEDWVMHELSVEQVVAAAEAGETYPLQVEDARLFARALCRRERLQVAA